MTAEAPALAKLVDFERAVYLRTKGENRLQENQDALQAMLQCLRVLRDGRWFEGAGRLELSDCTRMASAVIALFADPEFKLTQEGFDLVASERGTIDCLFKASGYNSSDFVFALIPEDATGVNKYLMLYSMDSKLALDFEPVFRGAPQETISLYLSLLGYGQVFTEEADKLREKLIALAPVFEECTLPPSMYNALAGAYMHCSYAHNEDKHSLKRMLHKLLHDMVEPHLRDETPDFTGPHIRKDKPRVVIMLEWWNAKHAMFRTYAKAIMELREHFYTIGICPGAQSDDEAKAVFDEWATFAKPEMILADLARTVLALKPDIMYYPSIGMACWSITMASLRLAPIQVMTYGHPATSNSDHIDYGIIEADFYAPECFSEEIILMPANTLRQTPYEAVTVRHKPRLSDSIHIGVSAMQVKVTHPFLTALREIQRRATKHIDVTFFSAADGVGLYSMANELGKRIANVSAQEKQPYQEYMASLAKCDICLFSFPFGGWNSTIDAMTLGIPMVSMDGRQPHSRSDAALIRRAGLPEWLIAQNEEEYIQAVLRLLDDDVRIDIAALVAGLDLEEQFFKSDGNGAFASAFDQIYLMNTVESQDGIRGQNDGAVAGALCGGGAAIHATG